MYLLYMNAFFSLDDPVMVYITDCKNYEIIHTNTRYCCSFITLREPCNNQGTRCDIACLHVTNHLYHGFPN